MSDGGSDSGLWGCWCGHGGACPRHFHSIQDLKSSLGNACRLLDGGLEPANLIVPEFYSPVATTAGPNSLLTSRGRFAPLQFAGMRFRCSSGEIAVRTNRETPAFEQKCLVAVSDLDEEERRPAAIYICSDAGQIVHRIDLIDPDDELIFAAATATAQTWSGPVAFLAEENRACEPSSNVIQLSPYLTTRNRWQAMTLEEHLDEIIADGGRKRVRKLRRLSKDIAWQIYHPVLAAFLNHLTHQQTDCTRIVPQPTLLQANSGPLSGFRLRERLALLYTEDSITALDLSSIQDCWAAVYGSKDDAVLALELYDREEMCLAVLLVDRSATSFARSRWQELILSLPRT